MPPLTTIGVSDLFPVCKPLGQHFLMQIKPTFISGKLSLSDQTRVPGQTVGLRLARRLAIIAVSSSTIRVSTLRHG